MHELTEQAFAIAGRNFSLDSPKQLQAILFDELKLPALMKTPSGQPSTNEEALEAIANDHALPRLILEYRGLAKLRSTYTEKLPDNSNPRTGRVHTNYNQATAATGRLSSVDPNLQNIPIRTEEGRRIRQAFVAPPGWKVVAADYSQIELRIMAHLSGDAGLLARVPRQSGHPSRDRRRGVRGAARSGRHEPASRREGDQLRSDVRHERVRSRAPARRRTRRSAGLHGALFLALSRRARIHGSHARSRRIATAMSRPCSAGACIWTDINSRNQVQRSGAERAAINAPMQGTAADIIKRAMIAVDAWLIDQDEAAHMLMQVHDELVFEIREDRIEAVSAGIRERMAAAAELSVPLIVDIGVGANWDEAH